MAGNRRNRHVTLGKYTALLADVGEKPVMIEELPSETFQDWESFTAEIARHLGPSDFMLMDLIDHGCRSSLTYVKPSSLMVVDENPPLRAAARALDTQLAVLAANITASQADSRWPRSRESRFRATR